VPRTTNSVPPFSENAVKGSVAALIGGSLPVFLVARGGFSMAKAIPVAGPIAAIAVMPALSAAITWAVGRVFLTHFESGGTTLDFDAHKMKEQFDRELERARKRGKAEA
jgi:uncharacterized protein (DUF697 family)